MPLGMRRLPARIGPLAIVAIIAPVASCAARGSVVPESPQETLSVLSAGQSVEGSVRLREPHRYKVDLASGQFLRIIGRGNVSLHLIEPGGERVSFARALSHVARETGSHVLEVANIGSPAAQGYEVRVDEVLSLAAYAARQDSLQRDPRVEWLTGHAIPLRTISSDDDDFADLQRLRDIIGDAHVVLLGEESHYNGAVVHANARLVRFLHQELGFDVIAFEAGLYDMWKVWQLIEAGHDPADVMPQGLWPLWSRAAAFQPLARYIGHQTAGAHPLEVAGVDPQFTGTLSRQQLVPELRERVAREGFGVEGQDVVRGFWTTLARFQGWWGGSGDSPLAPRDQEDMLSGVRWLAERMDVAAESRSAERRELRMWAQVCRSLAQHMEEVWSGASQPRRGSAEYDRRDQQMARNLTWLAQEYFPGRRIIVWAANPHILRQLHRLENPFRGPESQGVHFPFRSMGQTVWEVFGARSFVIAATVYGGQYSWGSEVFTVARDQDKAFELEELLAATDLDYAVLPLRDLPPAADWLRAPNPGRLPWFYRTILATWPDHTDAVLFLRASTPRVRVPERQ